MTASPAGTAANVTQVTAAIAANTRSWRQRRGWSLDTLAARAGLSKGMLLQVEQGRTNPSIATLCRLSEALGVALATLVEPLETAFVRSVTSDQTPVLWRGPHGGSARLLLGTDPPVQVELWEWELAPTERFQGEAHPPGSRELLSVRSGTLTLEVGDERSTVAPGGGAHFLADHPHAYANNGTEPVTFSMTVVMAEPAEERVDLRTSPTLRLRVLPGRFSVSRRPAGARASEPALPSAATDLWSITCTAEETSFVTAEADAPADAVVEAGWRAFQVAGPLAFDLIGVLASLTVPLAAAGIGVFAQSTFDTDYLLVQDRDLERAAEVLAGAGHDVDRGAIEAIDPDRDRA